MIAAAHPIQRPVDARMLVVDAAGNIRHRLRSAFAEFLRAGDLVIANDAATFPANLFGTHLGSGREIEVRLAGRRSLRAEDVHQFAAVVFGAGDYRVRTEDRPKPPAMVRGDELALGPLRAMVEEVLGHPRLVRLRFQGSPDSVWAGLARHGRPIQYAHMKARLALWDVWTPIAGDPAAFEPPSAGFVLDWHMLEQIRSQGARFASLTHAAGISSTGDMELDRRLPFDEAYRIPQTTVSAIESTRAAGGRIIAIGTTVVRALEHSASADGRVRAGDGLATQSIGKTTRLRLADAILSGTHEPGTSHYELLRAFADDATLRRVDSELDSRGYRTHEFGDSIFVERRG